MTLLGSAESRMGRLRIGSHPSPDAGYYGADGARTSTMAALAAPGAPCQPVSSFIQNYAILHHYDRITPVGQFPTPAGVAIGQKVVGGSITQDIRDVVYGQGRVEISVDSESERVWYKNLVGGRLIELVQTHTTWNPGAWTRAISGANLGFFEIQSSDFFKDAHTGEEALSYELVSRASGTVGATLEGDLTTIALPVASGLGLVAGGQASIEGIAAYIIQQFQGRGVVRGPGITPTVAYQTSVTNAGTTYYLGPFNISPPMGAAQVLALALALSGTYITADVSGNAVLTGIPEALGSPTAPYVWYFGDDECAWPVRSLRPTPTEAPASVTVVNQSMLAAGNTETVNTTNGLGSGKVYYFNVFRPAGQDSGALLRRARQLAYVHDQQASGVTLMVPSHPAMRAGDVCVINLSDYGVGPALYMMVRITHPLGQEMNAEVYCEAL